jgi:lipopolysaccharide assembly outer membrane protein LptD (OstA)
MLVWKLKVTAFAVFFLSPYFTLAQVPAQRDSIAILKIDSLALAAPDSASIDTTRQKSDLDAPVDFEAQTEDHDLENRITYLYGKAKVKYKSMTLEAGMITVDWNKRLLIAEPLPAAPVGDSMRADGRSKSEDRRSRVEDRGSKMEDGRSPSSLFNHRSSNNGASKSARDDSLMKAERGYPIFSDGGDRMIGERMEYNFASEKGRVLRGRTEFQDGKYFGSQIKRVDSRTMFVSNGIYSTCDREEDPHFHFWSRKMKIEVQKNVVAKPIVLFIGKIPMAILPFAFFPTRGGRHSGLIVPRFGATQFEGRYLRELGYYWAISDYFDARATVDYYERSGWLARGNFNYAKRYAFTGSISGSFTRKNFVIDQSKERRWDIAFGHNQTFGRSAYLNASGTFASSNFYRFFSSNRQEQLRRTLLSQATFSKSFGNSTSFSAAVSDFKNLDTGSFERLLPSFSLSFGQRQLFGKRDPSKRTSSGKVDERHWYENFYYNLSSSAQNRYSKASDTSKVDRLSSANHNMSLSLNGIKAFFPWLSLNQSMQITENWYDRATEYFVQPDGKVGSKTQKGFAALHVFSYNASANTKLYGTFQPNLGPVRALRHVMEPSLGFSFRPDFSDPLWGYFQQVTLPDGTTQKLDRFNGATPRGKQASLNMSLRNLFQMKTGPDDKLKKIDLFTLAFFTSHNFAVSEFKQTDLSSSLFANPAQNISFNMSASHSFYEYDEKLGRTVNRFLFKKNRGIFDNRYLRLTNINVGSSFRFQGDARESKIEDGSSKIEDGNSLSSILDHRATERYFTDTTVPWQASFSLSLNHNRSNPAKPNTTAQLTLDNANLQLTKNWRVGLYAAFDLREKTIVDQRYTIFRDLHCWEMQFFWTPTGFSRGFYFRLGIKAPLLQDIKLEKRGGRTSVFGGSSYFY